MTVPGIGPIIASAMVAAIGNGAAFAKGRDFAAWLGLVPRGSFRRLINIRGGGLGIDCGEQRSGICHRRASQTMSAAP
jgi:Transposase IS116/IS110/IS902 family